MVADGGGIIPHLVHQPHLHIAFEEVVVRRALREVTAVEEQQVGMYGPLLPDHLQAPQVTAPPREGRIGQVGIERHHTTVRVVGMQDEQVFFLGIRGSRPHEQGDCHKQQKSSHSHSTVIRPSILLSTFWPCAAFSLKYSMMMERVRSFSSMGSLRSVAPLKAYILSLPCDT